MTARAPRRAAFGAAVLALALAGCQTLAARAGFDPFTKTLDLTLDRPSDLLPPVGLRLTSSDDRSIGLAWDPVLVGDVAGYAVLRRSDPVGEFTLIGQTGSRFGSVFGDEGEGEGRLGDGQTYSYQIHPYDSEGRVSQSYAHISATTEPAPDTPTGLRAYSNLPRTVVLAWDPSERSSTSGYIVMRSPTVAGPWERVGRLERRLDTVYEDTVPGDLRVMYYRIVALNRFGGESNETEPVRAVTKAEPLPPMDLDVSARRLGRVELRWAPNVESDLRAYEVWRASRNGDGWHDEERIAAVEAPETRFEDREVGCGQAVRYRLRAVDRDALTSRYSRPLETTGETIGLHLVTSERGPSQLHWDPERAAGWPVARVYEVRVIRPDRLLATTDASHVSLATLAPGKRRLAVVLSEQPPDLAGRVAGPTQRCELTVQIP